VVMRRALKLELIPLMRKGEGEAVKLLREHRVLVKGTFK